MEYEIIYHSGIKGMRWGVRRYQNPDGSLTPAGKKRYAKTLEKVRAEEKALREKAKIAKTTEATKSKIDKLNARVDAVNKKNQALKGGKKGSDDAKPKTEAEKEAEKKAYEAAKAKAVTSGSATEVLKFKGDLTPQEMQYISSRIQWEQSMQGISAKETAVGKTKADKFFEGLDKTTERANTAAKAWNTVANVVNALGGVGGVSLPKVDTNITSGNKDVRQKEKKEKKKAEEAAQKRAEQEAQQESKQKERAEKRAEEAKNKTYEGTVTGEGTSKGSSNRQKIGPVVDVDWTEVSMSSVSSATRDAGRSYVDSMLALPAPREDRNR